MAKKKKRPLGQYTLEDADFIDKSDIRAFSLEPDYVDRALEQLADSLTHPQVAEPGLTPLEFLLRRMEDEAKKVLTKHGYPTDLNELLWLESEHTYPVKTEHGTTALKCDVDLQSLSAKRVLFSIDNLRDYIETNDAEKAAIEMMRLLFAAICADLHDTIMQGIRTSGGQARGGRTGVDKTGYLMAIEDLMKSKGGPVSVECFWKHFEEYHKNEENQLEIPTEDGDYQVFYYEEKLYQRKDGDPTTQREIRKGTLKKYFAEVRKKNAQ
jgi:hypothetical protein